MSWEELTQEVQQLIAKHQAYDSATTQADGLMSSGDYGKLQGISAQANKILVDVNLANTVNPVRNSTITNRLNSIESALTSLDAAITEASENQIGKDNAAQVRATVKALQNAINTIGKLATFNNTPFHEYGYNGDIEVCNYGVCSNLAPFSTFISMECFFFNDEGVWGVTIGDYEATLTWNGQLWEDQKTLNNWTVNTSNYTTIAAQITEMMEILMMQIDMICYVMSTWPVQNDDVDSTIKAFRTVQEVYEVYKGSAPSVVWDEYWYTSDPFGGGATRSTVESLWRCKYEQLGRA